jgi:hypothetical protein
MSKSEHPPLLCQISKRFPSESCSRASMAHQLHRRVGKESMMNSRVAITLLLAAAISVGQAQTPTKTWDGFVTDTHCGTNCQRTSAMTPDRACVRLCVRKGSKYGLWYGNHVYALEPQSKAARFAAEKVHVVGELSNDVITITSIEPIPATPAPESQR